MGYVVRAKGVLGEVRVEPLTERRERFGELSRVMFERGNEAARELAIDAWRPDGAGVLIKIAGIDTPEEATRQLAKGYLTVPPEEVPPLPQGLHYVFELVGCQVVDESGKILGEIVDVLEMPSADVYLVRQAGREVMLPAVGQFVVEIAPQAKRVTVRDVEELFK